MKFFALDDYNDGLVDLIVSFLAAGVATTAVLLRCWARTIRGVHLWIDDWLSIAALVILWALVGDQVADGKLGIRTHTADLPIENLETMLKVLFSGQLLYSVCILFTKSSYIFFYRRIFVTNSFKTASLVVQAIIIAWFIANILQVFLICHPVNSNWDTSVVPICGPRPLVYSVMGSVNAATDAALMILPVPYIRQLHIDRSSKMGVSLTFLFGLLICAASITRTVEVSTLDFTDPSYELLTTNLWSTIEPAALIANSCIPLLRGPFQKLFSQCWTRTRIATGRTYPRGSTSKSRSVRPKSKALWSYRSRNVTAEDAFPPMSRSRMIDEEQPVGLRFTSEGAGSASDVEVAQTSVAAVGTGGVTDIEMDDLEQNTVYVRPNLFVVHVKPSKSISEDRCTL